ncbi:hypothetical protein [uncultured Shewanella sp.]|uniref:hypothetical protein n=1 Tax=uncultured Shewanella sp. TaxID=173975 RepID=UPI002629989D|nr:hypothetical protein [uncultured Shewanella sp.]
MALDFSNLLLHIKKLNDSGEFGFFQDEDIRQMPLLLDAGFITAQRNGHDHGEIYSKVRITLKGMEYLENQKSISTATVTATEVLKTWNELGVLTFLGILVSIGIFILS